MTTEFGFIKIADRYTTSSSMMPQKRNPDMLELIRGRCGNVYGDLFALMTILKGLPIGYNRDLQEDKRLVFRAYDTVSSCLTMAAAIVNSAELRQGPDRAYAGPRLPRRDQPGRVPGHSRALPFRTAHGVVGTLVAQCERRGQARAGPTERSILSFNGDTRRPSADGPPSDHRRRLHLPRGGQRRQALPERRCRRRQAVRGPTGGVEAAAGRVMRSRDIPCASVTYWGGRFSGHRRRLKPPPR